MDRMENLLDRPVDAVRPVGRTEATEGDSAHRPFAGEETTVEPAPAAIGTADREYPVDPALENPRHAEPPDGKLQHQRIAPSELIHLRLQLGDETALRAGLGLFSLQPQMPGIGHAGEVPPVRHWIKAHGVQIGDRRLMAGRGQRVYP